MLTDRNAQPLLRSAAVIGLALVATAMMPTFAVAKDTHAPANARDRWLPCEDWVMYHWLPFDERQLYASTGIRRWEWKRYIFASDDHHTLAQMIKRHGHDPAEISAQLMKPWQGTVSDRHLKELRRRTHEVMTQGHLSQHVFFHYFHDPVLPIHSKWIFDVAPGDYHRARLRGFDPREIAKHGGMSTRSSVHRARLAMRRNQLYAIKRQWTSPDQAKLFLSRQQSWTHIWLRQKIHPNRRGKFPVGNRAASGSKLRQSCTYMSGRSHPMGTHDHGHMEMGH